MLLQAFYQGIMATIVQMIFYVRAVQILGASTMGTLMATVPVLSGVAAIFLFDELVTSALAAGLALVSMGAWLAHYQGAWFGRYRITVNSRQHKGA